MTKNTISEILEMKVVSKALALKIAFVLLLLSFMAYFVFNSRSLIGTDYEFDDWDDSHVFFKKNGEYFLGEMIVDFVNQDGYLMILRAPAFSPDCLTNDGERYIGAYYSRETEYYLINLKTDQLTGPLSKSEFQDSLKKLKIKEPALNFPNDYYFTNGTYEDWLTKCLNKNPKSPNELPLVSGS